MASPSAGVSVVDAVSTSSPGPRHAAVVRATHWITTAAMLALVVSGAEIVVSHPRFYWGDEGNVNTPALFQLPIPASRATVPTGYDYVLPDQNGWSRSLHFEAAWVLVLAGGLYVSYGLASRHFVRHLVPSRAALRPAALAAGLAAHLRFAPPLAAEAWSYNPLQRLAYLAVIGVATPLMIWTGLAMSPAVVSAFPLTMSVFGGHQSARTLHFAATLGLVAFTLAHVTMVIRAGFASRVRAMITGRAEGEEAR